MICSRVKIGVGDNVHYYRVNFDRPLPKWAAGKPVLQLIRNTTNTMWSIAIPLPENETEVRYPETGKEVGIDLGLKHFATTSDGEMFDLFTKKERADLLSTWSRKQTLMTNKPCHQIKDRKARSKSYWKAHAAYREYEDYLKRLRQDRMYCLANKLVEKYDVIYIGKMNLQDLMKKKKKKEIKTEKNRWLKAKHKRRMRRNFSWGSMYTFMQILKHVAFKNNKVVVEVDERYSTMLCSKCQAVVEKDLSIRTHSCPHCGLVLDRDHNAAKNMIFLGKMDTETRKDFNKDVQKKCAVQKEELSVQEMESVVIKPVKKRSAKKVVVEAACEDIHTKVLSSGQLEFIL